MDQKKAGVFKHDPFQSLDQEGVGKLMKIGIEGGRSTRPNLKIGICGEHGGDVSSVKFCHKIGLNYVSCSPYRVPIARLAAAQVVVEEDEQKASLVKANAALAKKRAVVAPKKKVAPAKKKAVAKKVAPKKKAAAGKKKPVAKRKK